MKSVSQVNGVIILGCLVGAISNAQGTPYPTFIALPKGFIFPANYYKCLVTLVDWTMSQLKSDLVPYLKCYYYSELLFKRVFYPSLVFLSSTKYTPKPTL